MMSRSRVRAVEWRRDPNPWMAWLVLILLALGAVIAVSVGFPIEARSQAEGAQAPSKQKPRAGDVQTQPPAAGVAKAAPGVLKPTTNPDPGISLPTPNPKEFPTVVIKPPGTAGNPSTVVPR